MTINTFTRMVIVATVFAHPAFASGQETGPYPRDLNGASLCGVIDSHVLDSSSPTNKYMYQTIIYESAGVDKTKDSPRVEREKVRAWWEKFGKHLKCSDVNFSQKNGSILKYAVARRFDSFLIDFSARWQIDLNEVDESDGRTVLDYVIDERRREESRGSSLAQKFKTYEQLLRTHGAKTADELR